MRNLKLINSNIVFKIVLFFLHFLTILHIPYTYATAPISIITEEWPPYNYTDNHELTGFSTEIIKMVMQDLNRNDKILVLPGPRAMKVFHDTPRSMFFSMIQTKERKPLYKWIGPLGEQSIYFYKKNGSRIDIKNLEDVKKVKSICSRGTGLVYSMLTEGGFKNLDTGVSGEGIYLRMINDRCELAIGETHEGVRILLKKTNQPENAVIKTPVRLINSPIYLVANPKIPDHEVKQWQKSLEKVLASQEYKALVQKYFK